MTAETTLPPNHASKTHKLGNPFAYFKKCLKLYADARGRAGVAEYWSFNFVVCLLYILAAALIVPGFANVEEGGAPSILFVAGAAVATLLWLATLLPSVTVTIRRMHDIGMSGWWLLLFYPLTLIYVGSLILFVISLIPSSERENKHGPSPKHPQESLEATFA